MDRWETHITAKSPTSMTEKDPRRTGTDSDARRISGCLAAHPHHITFTKPSYKPWSTSLIISSNIHSTRFRGDLRVKRRRRRSSPTRTKCDIAYRWQNLMHYNAFSAMEALVVNCVEVRDRYEKLTIGANDLLTGWRKQPIFSRIRDCASRISLSNDLASAFVTTEWFLLHYCLIPTLRRPKRTTPLILRMEDNNISNVLSPAIRVFLERAGAAWTAIYRRFVATERSAIQSYWTRRNSKTQWHDKGGLNESSGRAGVTLANRVWAKRNGL